MLLLQKRTVLIYACAGAVLLLPALGMLFSDEVNWSFFDFLVAGILLFAVATALNLILHFVGNKRWRFALIALLLLAFALLWIEVAVGIFGSPIAGN